MVILMLFALLVVFDVILLLVARRSSSVSDASKLQAVKVLAWIMIGMGVLAIGGLYGIGILLLGF